MSIDRSGSKKIFCGIREETRRVYLKKSVDEYIFFQNSGDVIN